MPSTSPEHVSPSLRIPAQTASDIFSPLLMPTYAMFAALWLSSLSLLPVSARLGACFGVFIATALIPMSFILVMMKLGKVSDTSISRPSERTIPFVVATLCYVGAAVYLRLIHTPLWMTLFPVGAAIVSLISLLINFKWKISAHAGASGGLVGFILWMACRDMIIYSPLLWLSMAIVVSGIIASARLVLGRHTLGQVAAGTLLGAGVEFTLLSLV